MWQCGHVTPVLTWEVGEGGLLGVCRPAWAIERKQHCLRKQTDFQNHTNRGYKMVLWVKYLPHKQEDVTWHWWHMGKKGPGMCGQFQEHPETCELFTPSLLRITSCFSLETGLHNSLSKRKFTLNNIYNKQQPVYLTSRDFMYNYTEYF